MQIKFYSTVKVKQNKIKKKVKQKQRHEKGRKWGTCRLRWDCVGTRVHRREAPVTYIDQGTVALLGREADLSHHQWRTSCGRQQGTLHSSTQVLGAMSLHQVLSTDSLKDKASSRGHSGVPPSLSRLLGPTGRGRQKDPRVLVDFHFC